MALSSSPRTIRTTEGPSPLRFMSRTVINLDSSSPRLPSPSSFLKRTGAARPVFRRSSTLPADLGPQLAREDPPPADTAQSVLQPEHEVVTISSSISHDRNLEQTTGPPITNDTLSAGSSPHDGHETGKRKRSSKPAAPRKRISLEAEATPSSAQSKPVPKTRKPRQPKKANEGVDLAPKPLSKAKQAAAVKKLTGATKTPPKRKGKTKKADERTLAALRASVSVSPRSRETQAETNINAEMTSQVQDLAPARRRSWTPVQDQSNEAAGVLDGDHSACISPGKFTTMLGQYNHKPQEISAVATAPVPQLLRETSNTKKRLIEGAEGVPATRKRAAKTTKEKVPKMPKVPKAAPKKARKSTERLKNVTDHALAPYRAQPTSTQSNTIQAMLAVKETDHYDEDYSEDEDACTAKHVLLQPSKSSTGVVGLLEKNAGPRKMTTNVPEPAEALLLMRNQDFVFGTSSQLAKDDSPDTLRQLQQAIHDSEEMAFVSQQSNFSPSTRRVANAPHGTSLSIGPSESKMWSVSARDVDNRTLASEIPKTGSRCFDLPLSPKRVDGATKAAPLLLSSSPAFENYIAPLTEGEKHDSGFVDIDDVEREEETDDPAAHMIARQALQTVTSNVLLAEEGSDGDLKSLDAPRFVTNGLAKPVKSKPAPKPRKPVAAAAGAAVPSMADIGEGNTAKRGRGRPRKVTDSNGPSTASQATTLATSTVKKARGRPRNEPLADTASVAGRAKTNLLSPKDRASGATEKQPSALVMPDPLHSACPTTNSQASSRFRDIEEILDSEDELNLSPRKRLSSSSPGSTPKPLELKPPSIVPSTPTNIQPLVIPSQSKRQRSAKPKTQPTQADKDLGEEYYTSIYPRIKETIVTAPRTTDPKSPSWYEKILLYDPIVLEDLTTWLNAAGLGVSYQRVVASKRKKTKAKAKDKDKNKEEDEDKAETDAGIEGVQQKTVETITKDLEPWMVQKWCESESICCLWRDGLRGGVRQRY